MRRFGTRLAVACAALGLLLASSATPADDARRGAPHAARGQEVLNGTYNCHGTVFTDAQEADVTAGVFFSSTSGIASDFFGNSRSSRDVPADLDAMAAICESHVAEVRAGMPSECALAPTTSSRGEFGNGASAGSAFQFSCQGSRDAVVSVIGALSRAPLLAALR